jgi:hypothetical protein
MPEAATDAGVPTPYGPDGGGVEGGGVETVVGGATAAGVDM